MRRSAVHRRVIAAVLLAALAACDSSPQSESATSTTIASTAPATPPPIIPAVDAVAAMADATTCPDLAELVVDGLQAHVDAYAAAAPQQVAQFSAELQPDLQRLAAEAGRIAGELGCTGQEYVDLLTSELETLRLGTGVQRAVAGTFVSGLLGGDDPSDPGPSTVRVTTTAELQVALGTSGTGSTIQVAAGDYSIDQPLVVLRGMTLIGEGADTTTISSTAPGAAIVAGTGDTVTIAGLAVRNEVPGASIIAVTRGGLVLRDSAISGGRRDGEGNGGYGLVLAPDTTLGTGTHTVSDTSFDDNEGGGILVDGQISPTLTGISVEATTGCAVCWSGPSGGTLDGLTVSGGEVGLRIEGSATPDARAGVISGVTVGVAIAGTSAPSIADTTVTGASIGVAVVDDAAPELARVSMVDSVDVALRLADTTTAIVSDIDVSGTTTGGIVIIGEAAPTIDGGLVDIAGEVGVRPRGNVGRHRRRADRSWRAPRVPDQRVRHAHPSKRRRDLRLGGSRHRARARRRLDRVDAVR